MSQQILYLILQWNNLLQQDILKINTDILVCQQGITFSKQAKSIAGYNLVISLGLSLDIPFGPALKHGFSGVSAMTHNVVSLKSFFETSLLH